MIFSKENQRISKFSNKSNKFKSFSLLNPPSFMLVSLSSSSTSISPCCTTPTSLSPHFIVQCGMVRCTLAAKVLRCIRAALCQRYPMMHQRCLDVPAFCHAHLAEWMPRQLHCTNRMPCSSVISLLVRRVTVEAVVVPVCFLPVFRAELSIR